MSWFVLHTHPKRETLAQDQCTNQGFKTFLPTYTVLDPKKGELIKPLFPSYLFVQFNPDQDHWSPLCNTIGVKKLISSYPQLAKKQYGYIRPTPIPDSIITSLQNQIQVTSDNKQTIQPGLKVRVIKGILKEREGICSWSSDKRVKLLMDVMSGQLEVSFSIDSVELI